MAGTDDRDGVSLDATRVIPVATADGDDITVVPPGAPDGPPRRNPRRIAVGIVSAVVLVGGIALLLHHPDSKSTVVRPGTAATVPAAKLTPASTAPHVKKPAPTKPVVVATTVPVVAPTVPASIPVLVTPPPPPATIPITAATTVAPPQQFGASVLTWTGARTLTIVTGKTAPLALTAHNPTLGVANLPHPLSCTPRLDHGEMCAQMVQQIGPGQSAGASYTISAVGVKAGYYTLNIEGVLTINVTVTTGTAPVQPAP